MLKKLTITKTLGVLALASLVLVSIVVPGVTIAQQLNCANPGSNMEYKVCTRRAYEQADRQRNQVYRQLKSRLSGAELKQLTDAELAWIQFRDKTCSFEVYRSQASSGHEAFRYECLQRMIGERTTVLERYIDER